MHSHKRPTRPAPIPHLDDDQADENIELTEAELAALEELGDPLEQIRAGLEDIKAGRVRVVTSADDLFSDD
jgi:hypothetical protein